VKALRETVKDREIWKIVLMMELLENYRAK